MPRPDEGLIHAWLDGELEADEAARVERLVAEDAEWAAAAAEARGLIAASSRILGALDVVAGDVIPKGGSAAPAYDLPRVSTPQVAAAPRATRRVASWMRIAAGLVLVAGVAYLGRGGAELAVAPMERMIEAPAAAPMAAPMVAPTVAPAVMPDPAAQSVAAGEAEKARRDASDAREERSAQQARRAADRTSALEVAAAISSAPATALPAPAAPPPTSTENAVNAPLAKTAAPPPSGAGVAGGTAAGRVGGSAGGSAGGVAAPRLQLRGATRAPAAAAPAAAALSDQAMPAAIAAASEESLARILTGCWRTATTARVDSIQANPPITGIRGDTLLLALKPAGTTAAVTRVGSDELRGRVRDTGGRTADFSARRVTCTP